MLIRADARHLPLADGCAQCCVTSPPYWGLRDYGNAGQIGIEPTPDAYVQHLVAVFREVWRVLKPQGTLWLNLGDSYASATKGSVGGWAADPNNYAHKAQAYGSRRFSHDVKEKDLMGIPWRVAFALQADGWYLRADIIWAKPNPMPESVTDRPTKSHEYLFLLTKSERYCYDHEAVKDDAVYPPGTRKDVKKGGFNSKYAGDVARIGDESFRAIREKRNRRSVWTIPTQPYTGAHFATMPEKLVEPCILAGCPRGGLVLDPFVGSGTVLAVAERLGRRGVGTDLSYQYLAKERTRQRWLRFVAPDDVRVDDEGSRRDEP